MAFNIQEPQEEDDLALESAINVTPFIDVILVLLIIFMVAAPLATVSVPVNLPSANAPPQAAPPKPFYLSITAEKQVRLNENPAISIQQIATEMPKILSDKKQPIFIRADKSIQYDYLMQVMNQLTKAGYSKVALMGLEEATP